MKTGPSEASSALEPSLSLGLGCGDAGAEDDEVDRDAYKQLKVRRKVKNYYHLIALQDMKRKNI